MFGKNPFSEFRATQQQVQENKFLIPEEIPATERTAFHGAAAAAHKAGKTSFSFAGKKHPVTMKKDTANAIADQKEGYYKDLEIKKQDKEMGAKPVPAKKKKEAKGGGKEGDVEMNPKMDSEKKEAVKESRIRSALKSVLLEKENHSPNQDKAEKIKDARKGKGAEDMMADADKEIEKGPDAHLNEPEINKDNFKKMTSNVPARKMRTNDNPKGDGKIVPGGTQFKDPAAMKAESYDKMSDLKAAYASMYAEKVEEDIEEAKQLDELSPEKLHKAADQQSKRTTRIGALASKMAAAGRNSDKADKMYDKSKARQDRLRKGANAAGDRDAEKAYQASKRK